MLERINKRLIVALRLVVALRLLAHLLLKVLALDERVVQLGVGVADFPRRDERLEALAETLAGAVVLGEGGHDLRVADDERRRDALRLDELADELQQD